MPRRPPKPRDLVDELEAIGYECKALLREYRWSYDAMYDRFRTGGSDTHVSHSDISDPTFATATDARNERVRNAVSNAARVIQQVRHELRSATAGLRGAWLDPYDADDYSPAEFFDRFNGVASLLTPQERADVDAENERRRKEGLI